MASPKHILEAFRRVRKIRSHDGNGHQVFTRLARLPVFFPFRVHKIGLCLGLPEICAGAPNDAQSAIMLLATAKKLTKEYSQCHLSMMGKRTEKKEMASVFQAGASASALLRATN